MSYVRFRESRSSGNEQVRLEISSFLKALDSYLDRYAEEPGITFEQYLCSLVPENASGPRRRTQDL